jgi:GNAT superfamily N-acetyltransferase
VVQIRLGGADDVEAAVSVYERSSNEARRRRGDRPHRAEEIEHVRARLREPEAWFLVASDDDTMIAMAAAAPRRADDGAGPVIPGSLFLGLVFVVPERWGQGIGGAVVDAVLAEAGRRGYSHIKLWTHQDNERSHRLYRGRGFKPTGRIHDGEGEWVRGL